MSDGAREPVWMDDLANLLVRVRAGDEAARSALFARLYDRLRRLAGSMLRSYPSVGRRLDRTDIAHDLCLSLMRAFDDGHIPADEADFLRFAGFKLRRLLLDEADKAAVRACVRPLGADDSSPDYDPAESTLDPAGLTEWTDFHRAVGQLREEVRVVVELHLYLGLTQAEVAARLGLPPKAVSRLWLSATSQLAPFLPKSC